MIFYSLALLHFVFIGVMECIMFETEDLVCRKNEKHVILTLLEVARRGAKLGMLAPMLVQFEQEIDREIARWVFLLFISSFLHSFGEISQFDFDPINIG